MQKRYRLTANAEYERARHGGRPWAHPLLILYARRNEGEITRFGFSVSKRVGKAVVRNRGKRRLREAARQFLPFLVTGWDLLLVARPPIAAATYQQVSAALGDLLRRARVLKT